MLSKNQEQLRKEVMPVVDNTPSDIHLAEGISFQLRYLGSTRIFRYKSYHFWIDIPFALFFVLMYSSMFVLHSLTLIHCADVTEFTDLMYVFGIQINELVKMYDIISHKDRIRSMLDGLRESRMYPSGWRYSRHLRAAQRHVRLSSLLLYICASVSATMVFVSALFKHHTLPFASWYPLDTQTAHGYWMAYAQELGYVFYLTPINITLDTFLTGLMHFVAVKLDILREELRAFGANPAANCPRMLRQLIDIIVYHQDIVFMINEIEAIFNHGIFVQCITCGLSMCIVGYRILISRPFSNDFFAMVLILSSFLGEIFYYCHYGNEIKVKADQLSNALYSCPWYELDCRCNSCEQTKKHPCSHRKRMIFSISIIMERIKRPTYVMAGKLVRLSYETFISICRGGFQAFAVLRDMQL